MDEGIKVGDLVGVYVGDVEGNNDSFKLGAYVGMYEGIRLGPLVEIYLNEI